MNFEQKLVHGYLVRRYKRFLADIKLDTGKIVTAHCTNSGSMKSCLEPDAEVYISPTAQPNRKTRYTWEMIKINGNWVGINTNHPNRLVYEAIVNKELSGFQHYTTVKREVVFNDSRFDIYAENDTEKCFVEVKNVSMKEGNYALFPDSVTIRGQKHLVTLREARKAGYRAVMLFIVQRRDVEYFAPAREIDPDYAAQLKKSADSGVEIMAVMANVSPGKIILGQMLPIDL